MTQFSASEAAFEGFRITRERPGAVLFWTGCFVAIWFVASLLSVVFIPEGAAAELQDAVSKPQIDMTALSAAMGKLGPAAVISWIIGAVATAVVSASILRTALLHEPARLRLGPDEGRMVAASFGLTLINIAAAFLAGIVFTVLLVVAGALAPIVAFVANLSGFAIPMLVFVRFGLLGPDIVARHRLDFRAAWTAARGRFWPMLGAYALAVCLFAIVAILIGVIFLALVTAVLLGTGHQLSELKGFTGPGFLAYAVTAQLVLSLLLALFSVTIAGVSASAYRSLVEGR